MKLNVAALFGEHMILQRDSELKIWGTGAENDTVTVELNEQKASAPVINGEWMVVLKPEEACFRTTMTISSVITEEVISFHDVAIGEVWLATGQSNMEFLMKYDYDLPETKELPDDEYLRCYTTPQSAYLGYLELDSKPAQGFWRKWTSYDNRINFSAVGAYMGMILRQKLNVPVGIISCNWGGSPVAAWTAMEDLKANPALKPILKWHQDACDSTDWEKYMAASDKKPDPISPQQQRFNDRFMMGEDMSEFFKNFDPSKLPKVDYAPYNPGPRSIVRPAGLYENMLKKTAPYAIKGVIWYQGEDDDARDWVDFYDESMKTMVACWRKLWGWKFPFFQIELAPFRGVGITGAKKYDILRQKQHIASMNTPDMYNVCILDAGEEFNIHPRHKKIVGERLGRMVMKHVYGDNSLVADCPEFKSATGSDGILVIRFINTAEGLKVKGDLKQRLKLYGDDKSGDQQPEWDYQYLVEGDKLILTGKWEYPPFVKYCEENYCPAVLFNSEDNPVFEFSIPYWGIYYGDFKE